MPNFDTKELQPGTLWVRCAPTEGGHSFQIETAPIGGDAPGEGYIRVEQRGADAIAASLSPLLSELLFGLLAAYRTSNTGGHSMNKTFRDGYLSTVRGAIDWADTLARRIVAAEREQREQQG